MSTRNKNRRELLELAWQLGFTVEPTERGHFRCRHPSDGLVHPASGTTPDGLRQASHDLRSAIRCGDGTIKERGI